MNCLLVCDVQYMLKLPEDAKLELLKASVARRTGLPMRKVGLGWGEGGGGEELSGSLC